jgi:hypothetical protein
VARSQERVRLESGLRLSLPQLMRDGFLMRGEPALPRVLRWTWTYSDEEFASLVLTGSLGGDSQGWIRLKADRIGQHIELTSQPRHFGDCQFYFHRAYTGADVSVLWRPPGAKQFAARQRWGRRVAYGSQFQTPYDRALSQARKLRARIGGPAWESLDDPFPPKPKGMSWATYDRAAQRYEGYEATADARLIALAGRLMSL